MQESVARWEQAGIQIEAGKRPSQKFLAMPGGVRVEILEDPSLKAPVAFHHLHLWVSDIPNAAMQAWYAKTFGAIPGKRATFDAVDIPGANITFQNVPTVQKPTQGAALDRIGLEVKNLQAFAQKLAASGIKFDRPYGKLPDSNASAAFLTDPAGTSIELTEGLVPAK